MTKQRSGLITPELEAFLTTVQKKSLDQAAKTLGLSQSAVTKQISRLEATLGFELFDRSRKPLALTEEGRALCNEASSYCVGLERVALNIRAGVFLKPAFRLGAIDCLNKCLMPPVIEKLQGKASRIEVTTGASMQLVEALLRNDLDYVFVSGDFADVPGVMRHLLFEEHSIVMMPREMAGRFQKHWTWRDLRCCGLPYLSFFHDGGGGRLNDSYINLGELNLAPKIIVDSNANMVSLIARGLGWTFARPITLLQNAEFLSLLLLLELPPPQLKRGIYLLARKNADRDEFLDIVRFTQAAFLTELQPQLTELFAQHVCRIKA